MASSFIAENLRLNLAFVANLNAWPGLVALTSKRPKTMVEDSDTESERGARAFTLWLNSLCVEPVAFNLFENLKDGLIRQAFDKILPAQLSGDALPSPT